MRYKILNKVSRKQRGLGAIKEECKVRYEEMTNMVKEMGQKVEMKNQEMGKRLKKHEDETKECFDTAKEELTETQRETCNG